MTVPAFPSLLGLSFPVTRTPTWRSIKQEAISGKETRLQMWSYPRYKYEITVDYLGSGVAGQNQDWQTLIGFFNSVAGSALPFHWADANDNAVVNQGLGTGNGTQTNFNFVRALGGFTEPLQDVDAVSQVKVAGVPTTSYSLLTDPNWGLVYGLQFTAAPANGAAIVASFTYNWPCRFDEDSAQLENFMANFWQLKKISFETMKVL
jgi:uncharacterized protein (TIGR02217 family)